jgi:Protein of unknown function (DUF2568)
LGSLSAVRPNERRPAVTIANLGLRFIVELLGVAFVGFWGFRAADHPVARVALSVGAMAVFVAVWGRFLAPAATSGLTKVQKDVAGTVVLLFAAGALAAAGQPATGLLYAGVVLLNAALLLVLGGDASRSHRPPAGASPRS